MWSIPLLTSFGGILPLSASVGYFAVCTIASAGVTVGVVIYLCLNITVLDPLIDLVLAK